MKKKLIEAGNLDVFISKDSKTIYVDNSMLLTPGAKDELRKRKVTITRIADASAEQDNAGCSNSSRCTKAECDSCEGLVMSIAVILKEEYGITDLVKLKELSFGIADAVKANI